MHVLLLMYLSLIPGQLQTTWGEEIPENTEWNIHSAECTKTTITIKLKKHQSPINKCSIAAAGH